MSNGLTFISSISDDRSDNLRIEEELEQRLITDISKIHINKRKGRARKIQNFRFFDLGFKHNNKKKNLRPKAKKCCSIAKSNKRKSTGILSSSPPVIPEKNGNKSTTSQITEKEILDFGKQLGLSPLFSDDDTLNIIMKRLRK